MQCNSYEKRITPVSITPDLFIHNMLQRPNFGRFQCFILVCPFFFRTQGTLFWLPIGRALCPVIRADFFRKKGSKGAALVPLQPIPKPGWLRRAKKKKQQGIIDRLQNFHIWVVLILIHAPSKNGSVDLGVALP